MWDKIYFSAYLHNDELLLQKKSSSQAPLWNTKSAMLEPKYLPPLLPFPPTSLFSSLSSLSSTSSSSSSSSSFTFFSSLFLLTTLLLLLFSSFFFLFWQFFQFYLSITDQIKPYILFVVFLEIRHRITLFPFFLLFIKHRSDFLDFNYTPFWSWLCNYINFSSILYISLFNKYL